MPRWWAVVLGIVCAWPAFVAYWAGVEVGKFRCQRSCQHLPEADVREAIALDP